MNVVWSVTGQLVDESVFDLAFLDHKNSRHLEAVADLAGPYTIAFHHGRLETPYPGRQAEQLGEIPFNETKGGIILAIRVTDVNRTRQIVAGEVAFCQFIIGHMDEYNFRTHTLNICSFLGDIC